MMFQLPHFFSVLNTILIGEYFGRVHQRKFFTKFTSGLRLFCEFFFICRILWWNTFVNMKYRDIAFVNKKYSVPLVFCKANCKWSILNKARFPPYLRPLVLGIGLLNFF